MQFYRLFVFAIFAATAVAQVLPGVNQLKSQVFQKREEDIMESVFQSLPFKDYDYIMYQLKQLQIAKGNASSCDQCKNKIRFAKKLIEDEPEHAHLTNMMLYKDCTLGSTPYLYCTILDFFLTTKAYTEDKVGVNAFDSSVDGYQVVNFYDNDFLHFIKEFNVSNDFEVEYYCAFSAGQCELPDVESVVESFNIDSWWPEKKPEHYYEPIYKNQNRERFNVLHMSDAHIQFTYEQGAEANCSQLVCGLKKSFNEELLGKDYNFTTAFALENPNSRIQDFQFSFYPDAHYDGVEYIKGDYYDFPKYRGWNFNSQPATVFGGYLTDTPEILVNNSLIDMAKLHKDLNFEFALYSGDTAEHDLQSVTAQLVKEEEVHFFKTVRSYLGNISVLPSLGNHDTYVYSRMAPMKLDFNHSYSWNSDEMVDVFINNGWVDASDEQVMKSHYAGFSHVTPRGLKIITLNSNTYYDTNTWAFLNTSNDPDLFGNWKFLVEELVESEAKGQRVWINAHVPPNGADALPIDSLIFKKILQRFAPYTIANIFYGHTHNDELIVAYSPNDSAIGANEPITNAWVIQSLTPFGQHNPAYRYYEVEDESFNIIQSHNYYTPLNETYVNGGAEPAWVYEYSARDAYDPQHEWPSDAPLNATFWDKFVVEKLKDPSNIEFNQLYSNYWYRFSPYTPNCTHPAGGNITKACYNSNYCFAANIDTLARSKCLMK